MHKHSRRAGLAGKKPLGFKQAPSPATHANCLIKPCLFGTYLDNRCGTFFAHCNLLFLYVVAALQVAILSKKVGRSFTPWTDVRGLRLLPIMHGSRQEV